jgi:hypothetical protein
LGIGLSSSWIQESAPLTSSFPRMPPRIEALRGASIADSGVAWYAERRVDVSDIPVLEVAD